VKDRLFYFVNTEIVRRDFPGLNRVINTAFTDGLGNFNAACPVTLTAGRCDAARDYIMRGKDALVARRADSELYFGKLDWRPGSRHQVVGVPEMVLAAWMVGREMNPELFLYCSYYNVALIADVVKPLVIVWLCREDIPVAAGCRPLPAI
jgi:hypothetical protein